MSNLAPKLSSCQTIALLATESTTPLRSLSIPIGNCNTKG
jgi:hypothetical protein